MTDEKTPSAESETAAARVPGHLLAPPAELRKALAEALQRVKILRGLLRISEQAEATGPKAPA